jgi:hypothetical protein
MPEVSLFSEVLTDVSAAADTPTVPKLLYSRRDGAHALSLSIRNLDGLIASGQMKVRKVNRRVLIPHAELVRFAEADLNPLPHKARTQ